MGDFESFEEDVEYIGDMNSDSEVYTSFRKYDF
jgi:hypothetical protein